MSKYYYKTKDNLGRCCYSKKLDPELLQDLIEITEEEFNSLEFPPIIPHSEIRTEINQLKQYLSETDYKAIKFAEGLISEEEYAPIRDLRQS